MSPTMNAYKKNQINTATSEQLVLMLYDGARKFTRQAIKSLQDGDMQLAHQNLIRAQDIITELMCGVNLSAGEIAEKFLYFYRYMQEQLIQANLKKDSQYAQEVLSMLDDLRNAWAQIISQAQSPAAPSAHDNRIAL
ncbi:MAG: flagellar export chaperone FliS [Syntrophomonadaceae bacterium]|nr:flagellar export chaperone FliS [Syntrophomonadaceae bacterium]